MHVSTTQVLRKFAQKMAGQTKQANPLTALADPRVLGTLGGAAVGGLGAYGLSRLTQSEEDKETSNTPMIAGLLGALAGGAGGYYGAPQLAALFNKKPEPAPEATPAPTTYNYEAAQMNKLPTPTDPNRMPLSAGPRKNFSLPQPEVSNALGGDVDVSTAQPFMNGANGADLAAMHAAGAEPFSTTTGHEGVLGNTAMRNAQR